MQLTREKRKQNTRLACFLFNYLICNYLYLFTIFLHIYLRVYLFIGTICLLHIYLCMHVLFTYVLILLFSYIFIQLFIYV